MGQMSIIFSPGEAFRQSIALQTREKWNIPNSQSFEISRWDKRQIEEDRQRYKNVLFRTEEIPIYNCHGLTFASRRSCISETTAVQKIVKDDHYEPVALDDIQPGDIILYVAADG